MALPVKSLLVAGVAALTAHAYAQKVVEAGRGSYAEFPPAQAGPIAREMTTTRTIYVVSTNDVPVPTNQWWTDLLVGQFSGELCAHPLVVSANNQGINVSWPVAWNGDGRHMIPDAPVRVGGVEFRPRDARALRWGDWTLTFRMEQSATQHMDVTIGHGLPFAWIECTGIAPEIKVPAGKGEELQDGHMLIEAGGRCFGVFAPAGTKFKREGETITPTFPGKRAWLVIGALPSKTDLPLLQRYAAAIPRDSRMDWSFDPVAATVTTRWHLDMEALEGNETATLQGWIPHHYRDTSHKLKFADLEYATTRGRLKCAAGTDFEITYPFDGLVPDLPAASGLDKDRMDTYLTGFAKQVRFGSDTYWGGKDLVRCARLLHLAHELKHPTASALQKALRDMLADWFTYTPDETAQYFARYPNWRALVGFKPSYDSERFNDHHFHYGYFTTATALLAMYDPSFLKEYGPMARLVAKEYANWDRQHRDFPFLRAFDVWEGHSWASGFSCPIGNNQESSSEAMQSWAGLFLLGTMLGDRDMTAAGAMGWAVEAAATREYWFNIHGDIFPANYKHTVTGILFGNGQAYATYFTADPAWIHGIQWFPPSSFLEYLVRNPAFGKRALQNMFDDRIQKGGKAELSSMGVDIANVILGFTALADPDRAVRQMDELWVQKSPVATDPVNATVPYSLAHAYRALGRRQWDYHTTLPTSAVYRNERTGELSVVVYNTESVAQQVTIFSNRVAVGKISAPARTLVRTAIKQVHSALHRIAATT